MSEPLAGSLAVVDLATRRIGSDGGDAVEGSGVAGEAPAETLRLASAPLLTRPSDTPPTTAYDPDLADGVHLAGLEAFDDRNGYLELGGRVLTPEVAAITFANFTEPGAGTGESVGRYDHLARHLVDGAPVTVRALGYERDAAHRLRPEPLAAATVLWRGRGRGRPMVSETGVDVALETAAADLDQPAQRDKFLGLGHTLRFNGAGFGRLGGAIQRWPSPEIRDGMALVMLLRPEALGRFALAKHDTDATAGPLYVEYRATGRYRVGLRTDTAGAVFLQTPPLPVGVPVWLAATWNGATFELYTAAVDGSGWTLAGTAAVAGKAVTSTTHWYVGGNAALPRWRGDVSVWGLWKSGQSAEKLQSLLGRLLEPEEIEEDAELLLYVDAEPGTGPLAYERKHAVHLLMTPSGWEWALTLEGGADLAGQSKPVTLGYAQSVPLTLLGHVGPGGDLAEGYSVYTCHRAAVAEWHYLAAGWAPLAPAVDYTTPAGAAWDIEAQVLRLTTGTAPRLVPHQKVEIVFPLTSHNVSGTYTVADVDFAGRWLRVEEPLFAESNLAGVKLRTDSDDPATASRWAPIEGGAAVKLRGQVPTGTLTAWVDGAAEAPFGPAMTTAQLLRYLLEVIGPRLPAAQVAVTLGAAGEREASLHIPTGAGTATRELVEKLLRGAGAHLIANADLLEVARIDLAAPSDPVHRLEEAEIEPGTLQRRPLGRPPSTVTVGFAPAWDTASNDLAPDAWEPLAAVARRESERYEQPVPAAADYPQATPAEPTETLLRYRRDAARYAADQAAVAGGELWEMTLTTPRPVRLGEPIELRHRRLAAWHPAGRGWIVGIPRLVAGSDDNRLSLVVATVPGKGDRKGEST